MTWRLGLVAGEPSGDLIAARVLAGVQQAEVEVRAEGIGGPRLVAQGLDLWHPIDALSVFGYLDAVKQLPSLVRTYLNVRNRWLAEPPKVFLGIDAPDFNFRLEHKLKAAGIPTVHLVSPSIWAWRYERIHHIRESVSHMLVLFPFEEAIYKREKIPVTFVGHPLADAIAQEPDRQAARARLGLQANARILAVLPGSRASEIKWITPRFLQAVQLLQKRDPHLQVIVPMVSSARLAEFKQFLRQYPIHNLHLLTTDGQPTVELPRPSAAADSLPLFGPSGTVGEVKTAATNLPIAWSALEACDVALVASGTATLETALFKRPMVISYVVSPWVRRIMAWKSGQQRPYVPWVGLPNVLLNDSVVPELIQEEATPEKLSLAVWGQLTDERKLRETQTRFHDLHHSLRCDTANRSAEVILQLAHERE